MPRTRVVFFREADGSVPSIEWLDELNKRDRRVVLKCRARLKQLEESGHELRRPVADFLRNGVYELRLEAGGVNYRMLYSFSGGVAAVVSHGVTKKAKVPDAEIDRALARKRVFETDPDRYTYYEEEDH